MPIFLHPLLPALVFGAPAPAPAPIAPATAACVPQARLALSGITLGLPRDSVLLLLGPPSLTRPDELTYADLRVGVRSDGRVVRLTALTPRAVMPGGVHLGLGLEEVVERLHGSLADQDLEEVTWEPLVCDDGPIPAGATGPAALFVWETVPGQFFAGSASYPDRRLWAMEFTLGAP